ncbi:MAG: nucleotidyltransferase family protein [Shimia sp.]|uniref:nucleotidyltransferase family protein n=1 Tax=Shimia sp. TaxID=1954381 RepID=UPI001B22D35A|nr:nucleotidyltransferase family protein [Shimia sp.]MBO6898548.1 nucleotidyltransferase family protein [Shimia sp.]
MLVDLDHPLVSCVLENPSIRPIWDRWDELALPDCWIVAGCLAQTVWNTKFGYPLCRGLSDIDLVYFDLVYFDPDDLTESIEQSRAKRVGDLFCDLGLWIDAKNEARVHLWYEAKFGYAIAPYTSVVDAIESFPTTATSVGIRPADDGAEIACPFGLDDLFGGIVRPNKRQITRGIYSSKVQKWLAHWPSLQVVPWEDAKDVYD